MKDGGSAFPLQVRSDELGEPLEPPRFGMTLRDHFAGQVMAAFYSGSDTNPEHYHWNYPALSEEAYQAADAMIAQRVKGSDVDQVPGLLAELKYALQVIESYQMDIRDKEDLEEQGFCQGVIYLDAPAKIRAAIKKAGG